MLCFHQPMLELPQKFYVSYRGKQQARNIKLCMIMSTPVTMNDKKCYIVVAINWKTFAYDTWNKINKDIYTCNHTHATTTQVN